MADSNKSDSTTVPAYKLVVIQPFGDYERGDTIVDAATVDTVLASENAKHVTKVTAG